MERKRNRVKNIIVQWELNQLVRWLGLSLLVGIVAGLGAIAFTYLSSTIAHFALGKIANYYPQGPANEGEIFKVPAHDNSKTPEKAEDVRHDSEKLDEYEQKVENSKDWFKDVIPWLIVLIPAAGGLVSGLLVQYIAPEAAGHGTDAAVQAYHTKRGNVRKRVPIVKLLSSSIFLGTGGSGGREGPIEQIGSGFGSWIATQFKLSNRNRRILFAAGMGAGISAVFKAPLAAAIYSAEIMYRDPEIESEVLIPAIFSSIIAYCVSGLFTGFTPLFATETANFVFKGPAELLPYTILAVVLGIFALLFIKFFYGTESIFKRIKLPMFIKTTIGGALTGIVALFIWQLVAEMNFGEGAEFQSFSVLSFGYGMIQYLLSNEMASSMALLLVIIAVGKILTTSFTIGSGGSAGLFGPSIVVGGALGGALGLLFQHWGWTDAPSKFVILGMASFFGGAAKVPISAVIMVSELTGTYGLLIPSLWVSALCYLITRKDTLYRAQPQNSSESLAHRADFIIDFLKGLKVSHILKSKKPDFIKFPENMTLKKMMPLITESSQVCYPVVNDNGQLLGQFSIYEVKEIIADADMMGELVTARDVMRKKIKMIEMDEELNSVLIKFSHQNISELPVIDSDRRVIGMISEHEILKVYQTRLEGIRHSVDESLRMPPVNM